MNLSDTNEMRQLLTDVLAAHTAKIDGKFELIKQELHQIKEQTTKTNGRVTKLEDRTDALKIAAIEHETKGSHAERIKALEDSQLSRISILKFVASVAAVISVVASLVFALASLIIQ